MGNDVRYRRIYDDASSEDGLRTLVDRIWPRGMRKEDAKLDEWMRDVAPSTELRRWYGHEPERYEEFRRRYLAELHEPARQQAVRRLRETLGRDRVTLLTASHDLEHSQAAVLAHWLNRAETRLPDLLTGSVARISASAQGDAMGNDVRYRRIYDDASSEDGLRILVDRIWPRGMRKEDAKLDEWMRDVAPVHRASPLVRSRTWCRRRIYRNQHVVSPHRSYAEESCLRTASAPVTDSGSARQHTTSSG